MAIADRRVRLPRYDVWVKTQGKWKLIASRYSIPAQQSSK